MNPVGISRTDERKNQGRNKDEGGNFSSLLFSSLLSSLLLSERITALFL
ncbi:MAG: hypothetical protein ABIK23_05795 [candidate division WOR-3 bacterium]